MGSEYVFGLGRTARTGILNPETYSDPIFPAVDQAFAASRLRRSWKATSFATSSASMRPMGPEL